MAKRTRRTPSTAREYPRTARLNQLFQEILAEELERHDDDRLDLVTIMSVETDADLGRAVVYYDTLGGVDDDAAVLEALGEIRHRLQRSIASQTQIGRAHVEIQSLMHHSYAAF